MNLSEKMYLEDLLPILRKIDAGYIPTYIEVKKLEQITYISIANFKTTVKKLPKSFSMLKNLEGLILIGLDVEDISPLENLNNLQWLSLSRTNIKDLTHLKNLTKLRKIDLTNTNITDLSPLSRLTSLRSLFLGNTPISDLSPLKRLTGLQELILVNTQVTNVKPLRDLINLETLSLSGVMCKDISSLSKLQNLHSLDLSAMPLLHTLPDWIASLKQLTRLNLSYLDLPSLPQWLINLGLDFILVDKSFYHGINLYKTTSKTDDMRIFSQSQAVIRSWFAEREKEVSQRLNELKVVFLGDGEAGKSHTIARLLEDGTEIKNFENKSTPGIVIQDHFYTIGGENIQIHFWDFGGQEILHSMHRMFLTERTLYVVVVNARDETQDERARYWLRNVKSFAGDANVLLVLNKMDMNPNASLDEQSLKRTYPGLKRVVKMSALKDSEAYFNSNFTAALTQEMKNTGLLETQWVANRLQVKRTLQSMDTYYITNTQYLALCEENSVKDENYDLLKWFHDLGVSFCQLENRTRKFVILKPEWITNAIYILLFNKSEQVRNGMISHNAIFELLQEESLANKNIRRILEDVSYTWQEMDYVLNVIRKFNLSYPVGANDEFMPMLCQRESLPIAAEYEDADDTLEFRMEFDYLPVNVIHRLMVELRHDLDLSNVWRTGALFRQKSTGLSAVVRSEGELLKILVRASSNHHRPNTYLSILKDTIDSICVQLNLTPPRNSIIYKTEDQWARVDYEDVLLNLELGETHITVRDLRRRIPIQDILNQAGPDDALALVEDILRASAQLQANCVYWGTEENPRNTGIRDSLRNMGYNVHDQTLQGTSPSGKRQGELDLEIRKAKNLPWTICEGMRIHSADKGKWNSHLDKLLNEYNTHRLHFLIHLTYVDCSKDNFDDIVQKLREHAKNHIPSGFNVIYKHPKDLSCDILQSCHLLHCFSVTYAQRQYQPTVYFIFAQMSPN